MGKKRKKTADAGSARARNPLARKVRRSEAPWLDGPVPAGFWQYSENRRLYLIWLGQRLGYRKLNDYYRIGTRDFKEHRGSGVLLHCWGSSSVKAVMETFPEHDWKEWLFVSCPRSFWDNPRNHKRYMQWLAEKCGVTKPEDWYRITNQDFRRNKGGAFLLHYDSTISRAVKAYLPRYRWKEWLFDKTPKGFWNDRSNRIRYMKWLGKQLGYRKLEDWYGITREDFEGNSGNQLIKFYKGAPSAAVQDCFPDHDWQEWRFARVPIGFWQKKANRERYLQWLARRLKIRRPADWERVRRADLKNNHGGGLLAMYPSVDALLKDSGRKISAQTSRATPASAGSTRAGGAKRKSRKTAGR